MRHQLLLLHSLRGPLNLEPTSIRPYVHISLNSIDGGPFSTYLTTFRSCFSDQLCKCCCFSIEFPFVVVTHLLISLFILLQRESRVARFVCFSIFLPFRRLSRRSAHAIWRTLAQCCCEIHCLVC